MPSVVAEDDQHSNAGESPVSPQFGNPLPPTPCPPNRPEAIHGIVETVDRYNPQNIPILEAYVEDQMEKDTYDRDACLAVLKVYQFNPTYNNIEIVTSILALALGALPDADYNLCLYLMNEETMADPSVEKLGEMHRLLEQANFVEFWQYLESDESVRDLVAAYPRFNDRIRDYVSVTIGIAYQTISRTQLGKYLYLKGSDLDAWVKERGWTVDPKDSELVHLPATKENQARPVIVQESIKFEQLTKIIGYGRLTQ
ncbi:armadillo-type protein [Phlyctochytrium arcticum]|nr:armadillo-type protein [Phlyctochytrium arcticum]